MKNRICKIFIFLFIVSSFAFSQSDYVKAHKMRADSVIEYYKKLPFAVDWFRAMVKLNQNYDVETALKIVDSLVYNPRGDMFWFYPAAALYCYAEKNMPPEYKVKMRNAFKTYVPNRGDTENHWMMYYVSLYLVSQAFPNEDGSEWFNGKSSTENFKDAEGWLNFWIKTTTTIGQGEFDSPAYIVFYVTPLHMLYQFAQDPVMKKKAEMMLTWLLADFYIDYYDCVHTGSYSRIYQNEVFAKRKSGSSTLSAFLIGDRPLFSPDGQPFVLQYNSPVYAMSDYIMPEIIYKIAMDKSVSYENKEMKRSRNRIRYYNEKNPVVAKYNYLTKSYALGCLQHGVTEQILQHTWSLNWKSKRNDEITTFFTIQPYYHADDMGSLFPEFKKALVAGVVSSKIQYDKEFKVIGSSPFEKLFQHKNTLIGLYDLSSERVMYKQYNAFFPKDLVRIEEDPSGWIFCEANSIYFAFLPLKSYTWTEDISKSSGLEQPFTYIPPAESLGQNVYRLISRDQKNGFILEVKGIDEIKSFDDFKARIKKNKIERNNFDNTMKIAYTNLDGQKLEFSYDGVRKVNGKIDDPLKYKLFDSPYIQSEIGSEKMTIQYKEERLVLDLKNVTP
jgi:hypothetical protein